ncbi:MAG: YihY/virulence factor BrkB family protein [Myxococcales bacterium]|nr:YihY/virulence factor BrkB family protein [Myxococcales bacterium]
MNPILREVWWSYRMHDGRLLAGAVAFYVVMAATPFGVIALYVASLVLGQDEARQVLTERLEVSMGTEVAEYVNASLSAALAPQHGGFATTLSVAFILYVTTRLFSMLRASLNHLWSVRPLVPPGLKGEGRVVLRRRMLAFAMVFVTAAIFTAFGVLRAIMTVASRWMDLPFLLRLGEYGGSLLLLTVVMMLVYRWLPDALVAWRDAFVGGLVTATLASLGGLLIGTYLASAGVSSSYGAAGALVVLTLWIYYTCQIFFLGAEFTGAWARHRGQGIQPLPYAARVVMTERHTITAEDIEDIQER